MKRSLPALALGAALLGACAAPAPYRRPDLPPAAGWPEARAPREAEAERRRAFGDEWWRAFGDDALNRLVAAALAANPDILAASLRADRALLQAEEARGLLRPTLSGSLAAGVSSDAGWTARPALAASYELDLRGRLAAQEGAAALEAGASLADLQAARVAVAAAAIETWWRLAEANGRIADAQAGLAELRETAALVDRQIAAGAASDLERAQMAQSLAEAQAAAIDPLRARDVLRDGLTRILNGRPPPVPEPARLRAGPALAIAPGLPADLLADRPDLRAAELRLRAGLREVDAARAALYPQVTLTGDLGAASVDLMEVLRDPVSSLGVGVTLPFLNLPAGRRALRVSELRHEEAVVAFRQSLLAAFGDVSLALKARGQGADRRKHLAEALRAAREVERLTGTRYRAGAIALRELLQAQERRRAAETALAAAELERRLADLQLLRALGAAP